MIAVVNLIPLSLGMRSVTSPDVVARLAARSGRPDRPRAPRRARSAPRRRGRPPPHPEGRSGCPRPSFSPARADRTSALSSFSVTIGIGHGSTSNMLLVSTTRIIPGRAVPSFLYMDAIPAVKVRKKLYVTVIKSAQAGFAIWLKTKKSIMEFLSFLRQGVSVFRLTEIRF